MTQRRRVAVVGCGDVSSVHLDVIRDSAAVELVAVCDTDAHRREHTATAHNVPGFADHVAMFDTTKPDIVHVCTPHNEHARIAGDLLSLGVHVLLEKPLADSVAAVDALAAIAAQSSAKLGVCFQNRYNPPVQRLHALLQSGQLGSVTAANATVMWSRTPEYYASRPWRGTWAGGGGGLLMNQAIHTLDLLLWLLGDPVAVSGGASTRALADTIEVEDTADMVITHASGVRSVFFATVNNGANDVITLDLETERAHVRLAGELTVSWADGRSERTGGTAAEGVRSYWGVSHKNLIEDFYRQLDEPGEFWINAAAARTTVDLIQDVYHQAGLLPRTTAPGPSLRQ